MPPAVSCPARAVLERLLLGQFDGPEEPDLRGHVQTCPRCRAAVRELIADDTLLDAIRAREAAPADPRVVFVRGLIDSLKEAATPPEARPPEALPIVSVAGMDTPTFLGPSQANDELGRLGDFRVLRVLGKGGMGMVFEAEDVRLKRRVALKVMKPDLAANDAMRQRFLREAQAAAKVKSDHIVTIYHVGEERGTPYLAMEFLQGEAMDRWLKRGRRPNIAQTLKLGREIALGLAAAHEHGLIHRDIKPGNIWLEAPTGRVKILDFGLARAASGDIHLTQSGAIVGTPAYMAPEQARGEHVDPRSDLFSLGCVLYRLTTGQIPFKGDSTMAILTALALSQPKPVRSLHPGVPPALADLIERLLAKDPAQRPASARAVVHALEAMRQSSSASSTAPLAIPVAIPMAAPAGEFSLTSASPSLAASSLLRAVTAPTEPLPPRRRRNRGQMRVIIGLAAVALCCLVVLALVAHYTNKDDGQTRANTNPESGSRPEQRPSAGKDGSRPSVGKAVVEFGPPLKVEPVALSFSPKAIPSEDRFDWQPKSLVAILGDHRVRHLNQISHIVLSPDTKLVATGSSDGQVNLSDPETLHVRQKLPIGPAVTGLSFSPDGKRLAVGRSDNMGTVQVWDVVKDQEWKTLESGSKPSAALAFAPSGKQLATITTGETVVKLWEVESGKLVKTFEGYPTQLNQLLFSPNGEELIVGGGPLNGSDQKPADCAVWAFSVATGKKVRTYEWGRRGVAGLAISKDGKRLLVGSRGGGNYVIEPAKGKPTPLDGDGSAQGTALVISPDGRYALTQARNNDVTFWELDGPRPLTPGAWPEPVNGLAFVGGTRRALVAVGNTLRLWAPHEREELQPLLGHSTAAYSVAFSPDGQFLLSGGQDATVRVWDLKSGGAPRTLRGLTSSARWLTVSPDGRLVLVYDAGGNPFWWRLWELKNGRELLARKLSQTSPIRNPVTFAPDGHFFLAPAEKDMSPTLWSVEKERSVPWLKRPLDALTQCAFYAEGKNLLTLGPTGTLRLWDAKSAKELRRLEVGNDCVAISPDGRWMFLGSGDAWVRTIDLTGKDTTPKEFGLRYHTQAILSLAVSPDGATLASSGADGRVVLWDVSSRTRLTEWLSPNGPVAQVQFSPDGRYVATANNDGTIYLVRVEPKS